jgi:type II secretory pathway component PulC
MEIEWKRPAPYPEDLRDPMKKYTYSTPSTTAATAEDIVVRGIVWSEDSPAAVIGTEIIYEGQSVKGTKIINITEDSVEFERDRKKWIQRVAD